jgi:thiamine kinase-like enzyme
MLTSKASGIQLKNILMEEEEGDDHAGMLELYVTRAAMWLAKLHSISSSNLAFVKVYSRYQEEEKKLNEWSEHLSIHPDFGKQLQSMLSCILKIERSISSKCFVLIHNGFHPGNIFVDGSDLTVIDFDHSCISDPAIDLGYFIAKLVHSKREYNLSLNVESLEKRFLEKYASAARMSITTTKETLERVDLYKARSYIRHLHSKYHKQLHSRYNHNKPDPTDFEYWVNKAEECLNRWMKPACICIMALYTVCDSFGIMPDTSLFS